MTKPLLLSAIALASFGAAAAVPELIPGLGLPSLAEIGLTSEQLYNNGALFTTGPNGEQLVTRSASYTTECWSGAGAAVNDVIACFNYLVSIGNNACGINGGFGDSVLFVQSGTAYVFGDNNSNNPSTSSSCWDVALAVQTLFTDCNEGGLVQGNCAAYGNGNLIVTVEA